MTLLLLHWKWVLILVLTSLLTISVSLIIQKNSEVDNLKTSNDLQVSELKYEFIKEAKIREKEYYVKQIQAVNDYKEREKIILADASNANDAVSRLSDTINEISSTAKLDAELRSRYIDTSNNILKECSREYSKMGQIADRLSNEVRLLSESNRR